MGLIPYFIYFMANAASISVYIFIPLIAKEYGATSVTIGTLVAIYSGMIFLFSALFGQLADLKGRKIFIALGLLFSGFMFWAHSFAFNIQLLFLVRCITGVAVGMFPAALTTYVYSRSKNLGFFTAAGSLGFGMGAVVAGIISEYHKIFTFAGVTFFLIFLITLIFLQQEQSNLNSTSNSSSIPKRIHLFDLKVIKRNWRIYLVFFLRHSGASNVWVIYPLFLSHLGANKLWIGIIYGINTFTQVLFMPCLSKVKGSKLIKIGLCFSAVTFIGFRVCSTFYQILPFQLLLALSWSSLYLGSLKLLLENNEEQSTAIGIFNSFLSLSNIVGALLGGVVCILGYPAVMYTAALLTIVGIIVLCAPKRREVIE